MATLKNKKGHVLYHIQNMNITSDGEPYDVFVFGGEDGFTQDELRRIAESEFSGDGDQDFVNSQIEEFLSSSSVYRVWVDDIDDLI